MKLPDKAEYIVRWKAKRINKQKVGDFNIVKKPLLFPSFFNLLKL